jgi:hypothetical protein
MKSSTLTIVVSVGLYIQDPMIFALVLVIPLWRYALSLRHTQYPHSQPALRASPRVCCSCELG